jgi:putative oxidoreductase
LLRLFSTFPRGWPGTGLLLMRLVAGITLVSRGIVGLWGEPQLESAVLHVLSTGAGILLLAGFWTPFAGILAAVIELWFAFLQPMDALAHILLVTLGIALALVGPGAWSVDARLFGWKRIDIRKPKK